MIDPIVIKEIKQTTSNRINHKFIDETIEHLNKHLINVVNSSKLKYSIPESGYFCADEKQIVVNLSKDDAFEIYVHEYCHFLQYIRDVKVWVESSDHDDFLEVKMKDSDIQEAITALQACERDCEQRVIKLAKQGKIQIDIPNYYMEANLYIILYDVMRITKRWPDTWFADNSKVRKQVPTTYLIKDINKLKNSIQVVKMFIDELYQVEKK